MLSHVQLFATPWTVACQAPLSVGLSRQEYWNGLPFLSPGISLIQGLNLCLLHPLHCGRILYIEPPRKPNMDTNISSYHAVGEIATLPQPLASRGH